MRETNLEKILHPNVTESTKNTLSSVPNIRFVYKIDDALEKRGLTQEKLATICGLRPTTIAELVKGNKLSINKAHIAVIMIALRITDIREIIDIEFEEPVMEKFEKESTTWINEDVIPQEIADLYAKNVIATTDTDIRS